MNECFLRKCVPLLNFTFNTQIIAAWFLPVNFCEDFHKVSCVFVEVTPLILVMFECIVKVDMGFEGEIVELWSDFWSVLVHSAVFRETQRGTVRKSTGS